MEIPELMRLAYDNAAEHGFWDFPAELPDQFVMGLKFALMHSELSEALEAVRHGESKERITEELADCCIRIFDLCEHYSMDLATAIEEKMALNRERPYKHGKLC